MDLDRHVHEAEVPGNALLVLTRHRGTVGHDGDQRRVDIRTDGPQVEVGDLAVPVLFDAVGDPVADRFGALSVEENPAGGSQQADRPAGHEHGAEDPHRRIHPRQPVILGGKQGGDGQQRRQGVRQHVQVRGLQVVVVVPVIAMVVFMAVVFMVVVPMAAVPPEDEGARSVDEQPGCGHEQGLIEDDLHRVQEPVAALPRHQQGEQGQQQRAGEPSQGVYLAGAEGEPLVVGVAPRVDVGQRGDPEGGGVRSHVQAVGQQRHRSGKDSGDDLDRHHGAGDGDDDKRPALPRAFQFLSERMAVPPDMKVVSMHSLSLPGFGKLRSALPECPVAEICRHREADPSRFCQSISATGHQVSNAIRSLQFDSSALPGFPFRQIAYRSAVRSNASGSPGTDSAPAGTVIEEPSRSSPAGS